MKPTYHCPGCGTWYFEALTECDWCDGVAPIEVTRQQATQQIGETLPAEGER